MIIFFQNYHGDIAIHNVNLRTFFLKIGLIPTLPNPLFLHFIFRYKSDAFVQSDYYLYPQSFSFISVSIAFFIYCPT